MVPKPSSKELEGLVRQLNEPPPPPKVIPPQITIQLTPQGVSINSNIPHVFMAVGMMMAGMLGLLLKNQEKEEPSRIITLNP